MSNSGFIVPGKIGPVALGAAAAASSDWWTVAGQTCVAAYQPKGAASLAASYVNLANPGTYDAAPGTAPTLAAGGWSFNGSTQYLTTGIVPSAAWTAIVRFVNNDAAPADSFASSLFGKTDTNANWFIWPSYNNAANIGYGNTGRTPTPYWAHGVGGVSGGQVYLDGAAMGTQMTTYTGADTRAALIGAMNNGGTPGMFFLGTIAAIAIYSTTLSAADVAALTARMQAL